MAQHDYNIANQSGLAFRQDLNNALSAIVSINSGAAEPSTTFAYMFWADTTNNLLKMRNAANSAWITLRELDGTLTIEDGTAAAPGLAFASDLNTGIYRVGADQIGIATGGTGRLMVDASGNLVLGDVTDTNTYLHHPAADTLAVTTNGSERARIDSSGRLLVGTSTAATAGDAQYAKMQVVSNTTSATSGAVLALLRSQAATGIVNNDLIGEIVFGDSAGNPFAFIAATADATSGNNDYPGRLVFSTTADGASSPTERMRIDSRGRVNVGGTGGLNAGFTVDWPANALEPVIINDTSNTAGQTHRISFRTGGTETGKIISGTTLGTSYVTSSDYRLKQGIVDLENAGSRLAQLKPRRFSFINSPETVIDGFIAHEVQDIVPEAITGEKDAVDDDGNPVYQGIDHSRLVPLLTAALQEAIGEIESLKARLTAAGI